VKIHSVILAALGAVFVIGATVPAMADRDDWRRREWREHEWRVHEWREHEWREHEWREHHHHWHDGYYSYYR
jgi:hypothetical protein